MVLSRFAGPFGNFTSFQLLLMTSENPVTAAFKASLHATPGASRGSHYCGLKVELQFVSPALVLLIE